MATSTTTSQGATSLSLLERARGKEPEAWRRLVLLYSPLVFSWAKRSGLNDADAADIVQEVWQSVATAIARFERDQTSGTFRGWLWTVTRNKLNDQFRRREGMAEAVGGTAAREFLQEIPEYEPQEEANGDDHGLLHRALELIRPEFEERTWKAFWRMTVDNHAATDIGQDLGLAANAVHQAKFRVLRRLREEMSGLVALA